MKPFRWNLAKKEQLGKLIKGERDPKTSVFNDEIKHCSARILAFSKQANLIFVGRSPESFFDYLSGINENSSLPQQLSLLNISNRFRDMSDIRAELPASYNALKTHFNELELSPSAILRARHGVCFVDLVAAGGTYKAIYEFLVSYCHDEKADLNAVMSKVHFLGITMRSKNSPKTWRWQQKASWVKEHDVRNIKNISISVQLWDYLGNWQDKVAKTNPPNKWDDESILLPPREEDNLRALRRAYDLYTEACQDKKYFSNLLAKEDAMKEAWFRQLVTDLKNSSS